MSIQAECSENTTTLEQLVARTCFCKLRSHCHDKNSKECLKHHNIYAEFMEQKRAEHDTTS